MIYWQYTGFDKLGKSRKGKILASVQEEAHTKITGMGITPTKISKSQDIALPWENRPPGLKARTLFTKQLAQNLGGSVQQGEAFRTAGNSSTNKVLRNAIADLVKEMDGGTPLDEAVAKKKYNNVFDPVFVAFIRMGSVSGDIAEPIDELAKLYNWQLKMIEAVKKSTTLPAIILVFCIVITYGIMAKVVPTFMKILDGLNAPLPPLTKAVKTVSEVAANPFVTIGLILAIAGAIYGLLQYKKTPAGKRNLDLLVLRLPIMGPVVRDFILARTSRSLAVMMRSGVPLPDALQITSEVAANQIYREHFLEMRSGIHAGEAMYGVVAQYPKEFPEVFGLQFRAAEEKQSLKLTLQFLSDLYESEVQTKVESLGAALEPFLMVFLGGIVGIIVFAVFLPMTTMMDALQK